MRKSQLKHPVALLRTILGLTQPEFAKIMECSAATIQSVELNNGRLQLSEKLAERISFETGVSVSWLMGNDTSTLPDFFETEAAVRDRFHLFQSDKHNPSPMFGDDRSAKMALYFMFHKVASTLLAAYGAGRLRLCDYKLQAAVDAVYFEFNGKSILDEDLYKLDPEHGVQAPDILKVWKAFSVAVENEQIRFEPQPKAKKFSEFLETDDALKKVAELTGINPQYIADAQKLKAESPEKFQNVIEGTESLPAAVKRQQAEQSHSAPALEKSKTKPSRRPASQARGNRKK